ncbi:MAG: 3-dehydroquinate synthase, partial [Deltaproteobacteria bacterium]
SNRMERNSPIVALGGGVVGDIAGFAAATYLRGVPYVQVPTTLLSQVDSSVGGKTGVNHKMGKNLIGAFYQPRAVLVDPDALNTLDKREFNAGMAEVVKYGVIWDKEFFAFIEREAGNIVGLKDELIGAIETSCGIKAEVVGRDEKEEGLRSILNFGHTFGHAIEAIAGYGHYRHGEAIAIGMVLAAGLSAHLGLSGLEVRDRIKALLTRIGLPVEARGIDAGSFIRAMRLDKKVERDRIRFVLATEIGKVFLREVSEDELMGFFSARG